MSEQIQNGTINRPATREELVEKSRRAARAVYVAVQEPIARDISFLLDGLAEELERHARALRHAVYRNHLSEGCSACAEVRVLLEDEPAPTNPEDDAA